MKIWNNGIMEYWNNESTPKSLTRRVKIIIATVTPVGKA